MFATVFGMDCADVYGAQKRCLLAVDCSYYGCIECRYRHHRKSMHTMAFFYSTPSLLTAARKQKMLNFFFFHVVLQPVLCNYRFSSFCILTESARNHHAIVHMNNVASILWFFFFCLGCLSVARLKKKHRLLTRCIQHELRRNYRKLWFLHAQMINSHLDDLLLYYGCIDCCGVALNANHCIVAAPPL